MGTPLEILKQYWGYNEFRPLQEEIIGSLMAGNDTLALLPTGGGKSVCYQVPAMCRDGVCLVISPLIALMQDQVERLHRLGVPAACIHSGMSKGETDEVLEKAMHSKIKLLYVSPERLRSWRFNDYFRQFDLSFVAVDEAHCISQWGHDFRPDYLHIAVVREFFPSVPVLALTATATPDVARDIMHQLRCRKPAVYRQSFARTNIFYEVRYSENKAADMLSGIAAGCNIVYCRSRKQTETATALLKQYGISAATYHAGLPKEARDEAQRMWMNGAAQVMVATTAFGMGIDKPDVRMVLHYDAPEHLEAYFQEAGRAGRDGQPAAALLLYHTNDVNRLLERVDIQYPAESYLRKVYQAVAEYLGIAIGVAPSKYFDFDIGDFCKKFKLEPLPATHALKLLEREDLWTLTDSFYHPSTIRFTATRQVLDDMIQAYPNLGYVIVGLLRMYTGIFHYPAQIREAAVARQLKMSVAEFTAMVRRLEHMEVLEYVPAADGPRMLFHHTRADSRHLIINTKRIQLLRVQHEQRTKAIVGFLEDRTQCRENMLLRYFGEEAANECGHCDVCRSKAATPAPEADVRQHILRMLTSGAQTVGALIAGYTGTEKRIATELIRSMIDDGMLRLTDGGRVAKT